MVRLHNPTILQKEVIPTGVVTVALQWNSHDVSQKLEGCILEQQKTYVTYIPVLNDPLTLSQILIAILSSSDHPLQLVSNYGGPLKTTFDMTTSTFSSGGGGCPSYPSYPLKGCPTCPCVAETLPMKSSLKTT